MADLGIQLRARNALSLQAQNALISGKTPLRAVPTADVERARRVSQEFEAVFLGQVLQPMFSGIKAEEPFGGGFAAEMWRSLQVAEYGKAMARAGGIGIGDAVFRQILQTQEVK